jgi:hypothetical protein
MPPRLRTVVAVVLLLAAGLAAWRHFTSPQRQVLRRLGALADLLAKDGPENQLTAAATARGVAGFFAPGFFVRADPYEGELADPQQLMGAVMRLRGPAQRLDVAFSDRDVRLDEVSRTAVVGFVGTVSLDRGAGQGRESWRVRTLWVEDDGEWRIAELELLEQIETGGLFPGR